MRCKYLFLIILLILFLFPIFGQTEYNYIQLFLVLSEKKIATFNDGIALTRILYDEYEENSTFVKNILWAAKKKLFQVKIPIKYDAIDPLLTRQELSYWFCMMARLIKGVSFTLVPSKRNAFNLCVHLGLMHHGRGPADHMSGLELLALFDNYQRWIIKRKKQLVEGELKDLIETLEEMEDEKSKLNKKKKEQEALEKKKARDIKRKPTKEEQKNQKQKQQENEKN